MVSKGNRQKMLAFVGGAIGGRIGGLFDAPSDGQLNLGEDNALNEEAKPCE